MIGIIKIVCIIYLTLSVIYFIFTGKHNLLYLVRYKSTFLGKIKSILWIISFSLAMGGFLVMKGFYRTGKRAAMLYTTYRKVKKMTKKMKK